MRTQEWAERGWVPDAAIRWGIRRVVRARLAEQERRPVEERRAWLGSLDAAPIALRQERANRQHYEVPSAFFDRVLGPHRKYSCAWWEDGETELGAAEVAMLERTAQRADLGDGASILDLGCGWGSFSLWAAERYPHAEVVAVSNSKTQREFVLGCAQRRGLHNLEVRTADVSELVFDRRFDRIVSVEMFEHLRNWRRLLERAADWLEPEGRVFLHYFCHREYAYPYEDRGPADWMTRHFFEGGMMPSRRLIDAMAGPFAVEDEWTVSGTHYARTAEAWLRNLDAQRAAVRTIFAEHYGPEEARRWIGRWRLFFLACAELFGYRGGSEWHVAHVRLAREGRA